MFNNVLAACLWLSLAAAPPNYGKPELLATLENTDIDESSGIACGRANKGIFWTHNDSGDRPRIYAFGRHGEDIAAFKLAGAINHDWEDIASFTLDGKPYLLIGDVGDNSFSRDDCSLYLVREPVLDGARRKFRGKLRVEMPIDFRYEDGPRNCEAVAFDPTSRLILLATKSLATGCRIYSLPLPRKPSREVFVAKLVATVKVPMVTAMDISPDGRRAILLTYGDAFEFARRPGEPWKQAFARPPRRIAMPPRRQGEAICYGPDGVTLYLTSEKTPTPLLEVPAEK